MNVASLNTKNIRAFQKRVLSFYSEQGRDLPWRNTTDAYSILISEVMAQQTQIDRVLRYYQKWITKWPTVQDLAEAPRKEVLHAWMGLGYNSRAVNLHEAAKKIVAEYAGDVIAACEDYKNIKGIGPYTSGAVRIFSTNIDIVTVDTNIRRILIHEFGLPEDIKDKDLWQVAEECLPPGKSRDWHNALMDYGSTVATARKTGIKPKTRQSKFEGSDRQIRAKIVRYLLVQHGSDFEELLYICDDKKRLQRILDKLVRDNIIRAHGPAYLLVE